MAVSGKRQLEVILNYRDNLSGKAGRTVASLRAIDAQAGRTLKTVEALNKAIGRRAGGGQGRGTGPRRPGPDEGVRPRRPAGVKPELDQVRLQTQQTKLQREEVRLQQDNVRLTHEEARAEAASTKALAEEVRLRKEKARLAQVEARTDQIRARTSSAGDLADLRLIRERIRLQREELRLQNARRSARAASFNGGVQTTRNAAHVAGETYDALRGFTDPAVRNIRAEERFRIMGFTPDQNRMGFEKVDEVTRSTRGVRRADMVETLTGLINTFGDVEEAVQFLPITARYRANMEALYGDVYSPQQVTKQVSDAFKALELLGIDQPTGRDAAGRAVFVEDDRRRMEQYFNIIAQATAATGGEINPGEFREFVQYMKIAGTNLSPEGLQKMIPLVQQMGGSQAGTGLMTLYSNLVGGRIPSHKLRYWEEMGLLDRSKVEFNKTTGEVQRLLPGAIPIAQDLGRDPVAVADRIGEALARKGIDTKDKDAVNKQLMAMLGDRTGLGELAQMINFRASIDKEVEKNARSFDINRTYESSVLKSPLGDYLDLRAQKENTLALAGRSTAEAGGTLAGYLSEALRKVQGQAGQNSAFDMAAVGVLTLGKASAEAADGVGLFDKLLRGAGGSGGGGIAGTGADTSDVVTGGWALGKGLRWGGRAALGLAGSLYAPAAIAGLGALSIYALHEQYESNTEARRKATSDASSQFDNVRRLREQHGGRLPEDVARQLAASAFPGVNRAGLLNELDLKTYGSPGYPGVRATPAFDRNKMLAGEFARRAPELGFAEVMRGFIEDTRRRVESGQMAKPAGDRQLEIAAQAFPESYKAATQSLAQELSALGASVAPLPELFGGLLDPGRQFVDVMGQLRTESGPLKDSFKGAGDEAGRLPGHFGRAGVAADNFASRLSQLRLDPPSLSFSLPPVLGPKPSVPGMRQPFTFNSTVLPQSAVGSVIERDGPVMLHRGNVVTPARLSRRSPGDWLEDFDALRAFDRGAAEASDGAGEPDYSAFITAPAVGPAGGQVITFSPVIQVPAGHPAAQDTAALVALLEEQMRRLAAQLAETRSELHDPRFITDMAAVGIGRERARA